MPTTDEALRETFLRPIRKCADYVPAFGKGKSGGLTLSGFQTLYGGDPFYAWLGLDDPSVYASHKAAGGLTSLYRQVGVGSERLFRAILRSTLELSADQLNWSYEYDKPNGKKGVHTLDALIRSSYLDGEELKRFEQWLVLAKKAVTAGSNTSVGANAVAFEVRQGYKSADSKRQNADLRFGMRAYQAGLIPALAVMSTQVSEPVIRRYRADGMLVLTGTLEDDPTTSTFAFFKTVIGFDLAAFLDRNSTVIKNEIKLIVQKLLTP